MAPNTQAAPTPPAEPPVRKMVGLPTLVTSPVDIGRLIREIEMIDESLLQLSLRKSGTEIKMPKTTVLMDQMIDLNKLNLLQPEDRQLLKQFLEAVKQKAPVMHVSFSADPNTAFIEKLVAWLRREIHPLVLMTVGLQPNIGAGCIIRTTNKYFDMSLKQDFAKKTDMLRQAIAPAAVPTAAPAPAVAAPGVPA